MTKTYTKEKQQEFLRTHSLTWAQRQKVIESKLERARLVLAHPKRENSVKVR